MAVGLVVAHALSETLGGGPQPDLLEARQMQALPLGVHIPLVCFGIAFPAMFLFVEGLYLRTGDLLHALDPALPDRTGHHLPRRRLRPARAGGDDPRGARARRAVRLLLRADPVLPRHGGGRDRLGPRPRRQRRGRRMVVVAEPDLRAVRRARRHHGRAPRGRVPGGRLAPRGPARSGARLPHPGAGHGSRGAARRPRRPARPALGRPRPVRRPELRLGSGVRDRLGDRRRADPRARLDGALRPGALHGRRAVGAITVGWALAQRPYLVPPELTLDEAAASDATLAAVLVGLAIGAIVLVPSLVFLHRLVLRGTLDQEFEPLDQRFRPREASDAEGGPV